jgi:hypothetical protein
MQRDAQRHVTDDMLAAAIGAGLLTAHDVAKMQPDFNKPAGAPCPHQRFGKGCAIYDRRPFGCRMWSCRWLTGDDTADLRRPDRVHYVIDISPDFVRMDGETIPVIQVWIDPDYPDAHRDPGLRAFLERRAKEGWAALVRSSAHVAFVLLAPPMTGDGQWHALESNACAEKEHSIEDKIAALGPLQVELRKSEDAR